MADTQVFIYYGTQEDLEVFSTPELAERSLNERLATGKVNQEEVTVIRGYKIEVLFGAKLQIL